MNWQNSLCRRFKLCHEKSNFFAYAKTKTQISFADYREADQRLCFRYTEITIPLLPKSFSQLLWLYSPVTRTLVFSRRGIFRLSSAISPRCEKVCLWGSNQNRHKSSYKATRHGYKGIKRITVSTKRNTNFGI